LFLTPVVFVPGLLGPFEAPKAAVVRTAGVALAILALADPRTRRAFRPHVVDGAVALWLLVEALATGFSRAPFLSLVGEQKQHEGLLTSLGLAGLYLGVRLMCSDRREERAVTHAWVAGAALASVYALMQVARLDPIDWGVVPTFAGVNRPFGSLGHANLLGAVTAPAAVAAVTLALAGPRRALYRAMAVLLACTTALTLSRGAWLGLAAGLGVGLAFVGNRTGLRPSRGAAIVATAGVIALSAVALVAGWADPFVARFRELLSPVQGSGISRLEIWKLALALWRDRPLLGQGPDTFALVSTQFQTPALWRYEWGGVADHAHSIYLHALATRGALGLVAAGAAVLALVRDRRRPPGSGSERDEAAARGWAVLASLAVVGAFGALGVTGAAIVATTLGIMAARGGAEAATSEPVPPRRGAKALRRPAPLRAPARAWVAWLLAAAAACGIVTWSVAEAITSHEMVAVEWWMGRIPFVRDDEGRRVYAALAERSERALRLPPFDDSAPRALSAVQYRTAFGSPAPGPLLDDAAQSAREAIRRVPLRAELASGPASRAFLSLGLRMYTAGATHLSTLDVPSKVIVSVRPTVASSSIKY
jgi:O-antigen ligase